MLIQVTKRQALEGLSNGEYPLVRCVRPHRDNIELESVKDLEKVDGRKYTFYVYDREYYKICREIGLI